MATVDKHQLLFSTDLNYFKQPQLIDGRYIYDKYNIARSSIIVKYIDEKFQHFLAYPIKDGNNIEFHGIRCKDDDIKIFSDLEGDEALKYEKIKEETVHHYNDKIRYLQNIDKSKAEYLTAAIKFIDDRFLYCYDDIVVLGAWGMQIRENVPQDITIIRRNSPHKNKKKKEDNDEEPIPNAYTISFIAGDKGELHGHASVNKIPNSQITDEDIPVISAKEGFEFVGWDESPNGYIVNGNKEFYAQYKDVETTDARAPWWKRFWRWLATFFTGSGCLKWFLRLLLFLILLFLLYLLLRNAHGCNRHFVGGGALSDNDNRWQHSDPNLGHDGGIYDPYNPYEPKPTPPEYKDVLPPQQGVLPPNTDNPEIIPGNPSIIANRLNILMENEDKSILDFAKSFKEKYPSDRYKVVYYDDVIKRLQIEIPRDEREQLKIEIPSKFAPEYKLFVFDEALFEGAFSPNDPAISDPDKSWYLKSINAFSAWDITQGSENITIAIVDNGFTLSHPELRSKVVQPYNVWLHSNDIFPQEDDHGTHVAGIALAIADNGLGLCGVAPACKFMPVQVADKNGMMTTTSVLDGIIYALYQGADVINVSLGSSFQDLENISESEQRDLINNHFKEEERLWYEIMRIAALHNSTIVVAAGNNNMLAGIDALQRPELFITVSAVDENNNNFNKASFSNYGQYTTISAPGVNIFSTYGKEGYRKMDGTSMAAPIISGAVALMKSLNDSLTSKQIICILQSTGLLTDGKIGKMLQLDKALQMVNSTGITNCTPTPSSGDVQVLLNWDTYNDLDLIVTDPSGESVWFKNRRVASGGQLEFDMNVEYPDSQTPMENIYWPKGGAPNGTYNVYLLYYKQHVDNNENHYRIIVRCGENVNEYPGVIHKETEIIHVCSFSLGDPINNPNPTNTNKSSYTIITH
ncbi:MAG: S8 family serine peptidase [Chitinophagales bacterium]